ncbi:MAG: putative rane protein, partial [Planctomycetaceae bacterium]|nr:putative rane protein [Planctomycetaceae bacterium]
GYFNVQPTAVLGMLGGFLTPAMLWPDQDPLWTLFPYLLMLDLGVLIVAGVRRWAGLEILAFCGTLVIWLSWHRAFYHEEQMTATAGFMTAFLVLFALLSVWHNVIRKRTALAGDFFLILITPIAYFAALYTLTYERLPQWQGEFSLGLMLFYALLAALAAVWHPAGLSVIAALAGLASTFLILAAPLELTGHWVTICWIAQAVLLVELGLYFRERSLTWTGLGLLAKVQGILLIYFLGTLADPVNFQTAFVRIQLHLIGRPETPIDSGDSWWALINGRSLSYLADVIGFAVLAWELGRRRKDPALIESLLPPHRACQLWLNVTIPLVALAMIVLETYAWGAVWHWDSATIVSAWTIWTALFATSLILWSRAFLSAGIEVVGWLLFLLLVLFVGFDTFDALLVATLGEQIPQYRLDALWLINARGISFLTVIIAGGLVSLIYQIFPPRQTQPNETTGRVTSRQLTQLFATCAFALAVGLFLLETRVWGANRGWLASTTISACASGTAFFLIAATLWRIVFRLEWVDRSVQGTFVVVNTLLIANTLITLATTRPGLPETGGEEVVWWLLNPRGIGYLISLAGCAITALLYWRQELRSDVKRGSAWTLSQIIGVDAYLIGIVVFLLETWVWSANHSWHTSTMLSAWAIGITFFLIGATFWRLTFRVAWIDRIVQATFVLLNTLLIVNTLVSAESVRPGLLETVETGGAWWLLNFRGISYLISLIGCAMTALLYWRQELRSDAKRGCVWTLSQTIGVDAYLIGIAVLLLETWIWGANHSWLASTMLSAWATGITLFLVGATLWRCAFRVAWVDGIVQATFGAVSILLLFNIFATLDSIRPDRSEAALKTAAWMFNPHGLGFLVSAIGCAITARLYWRTQHDDHLKSADDWTFSHTLGVGGYLIGMIMFMLETWVWGAPHGWLQGTLISSNAVWISLFAIGLVAWSAYFRTAEFDKLVAAVFLALLAILFFIFAGTLASFSGHYSVNQREFRSGVEMWIWNPRCISFLAAIAAATISGWLYRRLDRKLVIHDDGQTPDFSTTIDVSNLFGIAVFLAGVIMFSLEVYVQGTSREWQTATSLAVTLVWTLYATLALIAGIYARSGWLRILSLSLFVLTVVKVFLFDVWHLETVIRVFAFISLGVALLLVSFLYRRFRDRIRSWIAPVS